MVVAALAALAAVGAIIGVTWWDSHYTAPRQLERRYQDAQQSIREARADLVRGEAECRASAVEFGGRAAAICLDALSAQRDLAVAIIDLAAQNVAELRQKHCPGQAWCD